MFQIGIKAGCFCPNDHSHFSFQVEEQKEINSKWNSLLLPFCSSSLRAPTLKATLVAVHLESQKAPSTRWYHSSRTWTPFQSLDLLWPCYHLSFQICCLLYQLCWPPSFLYLELCSTLSSPKYIWIDLLNHLTDYFKYIQILQQQKRKFLFSVFFKTIFHNEKLSSKLFPASFNW